MCEWAGITGSIAGSSAGFRSFTGADLNAVGLLRDVLAYGLIKILVQQKQKARGAVIKATESNGLCVLQPLGRSHASTRVSHLNIIICLFSFMCE